MGYSVQAVLSNPPVDGQIYVWNLTKSCGERFAIYGQLINWVNSYIHAHNLKNLAERDLLSQVYAEDSFWMQSCDI